LPADRTVTAVTRPPLWVAVAVAPLPPPPEIVTVGALVYPLPPAVTLTALRTPGAVKESSKVMSPFNVTETTGARPADEAAPMVGLLLIVRVPVPNAALT